MRISLKETLEEFGKEDELESLREGVDVNRHIRISYVRNIARQVEVLITLLDDKYELSKEGDEYELVEKIINK